MISGIDSDELVLLKFTDEESQTLLHWEHSKEFEYKGEMYDVVESKTEEDTVYYWCWWDNEETELNKQLDDLVAFVLGNDPGRKGSQKQVEDFYKSLYCEPLPDRHMYLSQAEQTTSPYKFSYLAVSYPPPVPPPEIV